MAQQVHSESLEYGWRQVRDTAEMEYGGQVAGDHQESGAVGSLQVTTDTCDSCQALSGVTQVALENSVKYSQDPQNTCIKADRPCKNLRQLKLYRSGIGPQHTRLRGQLPLTGYSYFSLRSRTL